MLRALYVDSVSRKGKVYFRVQTDCRIISMDFPAVQVEREAIAYKNYFPITVANNFTNRGVKRNSLHNMGNGVLLAFRLTIIILCRPSDVPFDVIDTRRYIRGILPDKGHRFQVFSKTAFRRTVYSL